MFVLSFIGNVIVNQMVLHASLSYHIDHRVRVSDKYSASFPISLVNSALNEFAILILIQTVEV